MKPSPFPVLLEELSLDWLGAAYRPDVQIRPNRADIRHTMTKIRTLERLIREGRAIWACELRCPTTLYSCVHESVRPEQRVAWHSEHVSEDVYVIPGLIALTEFQLQPKPEEVSPVWRGAPIPIHPGAWLVRGAARRTKTIGQSLLQFRLDKRLRTGRMTVRYESSDESLRFHVSLAEDIWPDRAVRHLQVAALIAAMGSMATAFPHPDDEPRIARELRARLQQENVPAWDEDNFDPALAATVIEGFRRAAPHG